MLGGFGAEWPNLKVQMADFEIELFPALQTQCGEARRQIMAAAAVIAYERMTVEFALEVTTANVALG